MRTTPHFETKKPFPKNYFAQIEYFLTHYMLYILLGCIAVLMFFLYFDNETIFPRFFPIFLLAVLIVMFFYSLYQTIKQKVLKHYGNGYAYIFEFIESLFSSFSTHKQKIMTDSFQARITNPRNNFSFEAPVYPNYDLSRTLIESRPKGPNPFLNQENINNLNTIKSKEKRRNHSMEPQEIKKTPIITTPENHQLLGPKNIKGPLFFLLVFKFFKYFLCVAIIFHVHIFFHFRV